MNQHQSVKYPNLGFGLGLRVNHYEHILTHKPTIDWFEILTENYIVHGGNPLYYLEKIRQDYPIVMHGVSLSIGSTDPLNYSYLNQVKQLANAIDAKWISDHLCWTGLNGKNTHDLLPIPYTEEAIKHVAERVMQVQEFLNCRILLENVSCYVSYKESEMTEWEFLTEVANRADCLILLDINNIYVNSYNHNFNPYDFINYVPIQRVQQFHLAGHLNCGDYIIDTHDHPIINSVWELYAAATQRFQNVSTMIERDDNIPTFSELFKELEYAKLIAMKPEMEIV